MPLSDCKKNLREILDRHGEGQDGLLQCLHAAQERCGYLPEEIISFLAERLKLPRVEVYSLATFYSMFRLEETAKYVIHVCVSLPCYIKGSGEILKTLKSELNIEPGQTTPDKKFGIEAVSCLGLCDKAPAMMVNEEIYGNLTPEKVKEIISGKI